MPALQMHRGSQIGRAGTRVNPYRFNPIRELNRASITVITRDGCEWFQWQPRSNTIVVHPQLDPPEMHWTLALALAHRALGHWQNTLKQDVEARDLAARWLITDVAAGWAGRALPTFGVSGVAGHLGVCPMAVQVRLGSVCGCLANVDVWRAGTCSCGAVAA